MQYINKVPISGEVRWESVYGDISCFVNLSENSVQLL